MRGTAPSLHARALACLRSFGIIAAAALALAGCHDSNSRSASVSPGSNPPVTDPPDSDPPPVNTDELIEQGKQIFRFETFGDEVFWTDVLKMNEVIESAVSPSVAASVGVKVDVDALPAEVVAGIADGTIDLNSPQTTLALLKLNAVVGLQGEVIDNSDGSMSLTRVGITCALCHSTVSSDVEVKNANGDVVLPAGIAGHRLDGWPNRDFNPGAVIALSPAITDQATKDYFNSWGPGKFDPRHNVDGIEDYPVVIPPAFGLKDLDKATFTGDGDSDHEPIGPVAYWNRYVSVVEMGGKGVFSDPRLPLDVDRRSEGGEFEDRVDTDTLTALQAYQYSIAAPTPPENSFDAEAALRGKDIFEGQGLCSSCHTGPDFTDANQLLHPVSDSAAANTSYAERSATGQLRTAPLRGVWQHPPYFHDGSAATLEDVVAMYNSKLGLGLTPDQSADLVEYLKSL